MIWKRHLLKELTKTFLFLFLCILTIYLIVDLSVHGVRFLSKSSIGDVASYYLYTFSSLMELFVPLTFLLAVLRVLFDLNASRELVALQMAGLSKKKLLSPFFLFASFLSVLCAMNSQWLAPIAQDTTYEFKTAHKGKKQKKKEERQKVHSWLLEDASELVYQKYDAEQRQLFDVFWICSPKDIWHMKFFDIESKTGKFVNHLKRNEQKQFENAETFSEKNFPELPWSDEIVRNRFVRFENRPLSTLFFQSFAKSAEKASILTHLYYKLLSPLIPFFILFALSPITLKYGRNRPFFFIAAAALFAFISLKVILDGMVILGENQALPPSIAIFSPIVLLLIFVIPPFARIR